MSSAENRIDTFCGTCIFAEYDDKLQQIGCAPNMLARLREQGKQVDMVELNEHQCCRIQDAVCYFWRPSGWLDSVAEDTPIETLITKAREEIRVKSDIIIYCDTQTTFTEIGRTVDSIRRMSLKPTKIYFANNHMVVPHAFLAWANENVPDMPWRIESILAEFNTDLRAIDMATDKCTSLFISVFKAGFEIPPDFLANIDIALYDDLKRFVYLIPSKGINGLTFMRQLYHTLVGNKYGPLEEQIKELCENQSCPHMMRPLKEIVPSM
jgi:hypothetical protein